MKTGDIVRLRTLRHYFAPPSRVISFDYSPPKDEVFVLAYLGNEPKNGDPPLQVDAVAADLFGTSTEGIAFTNAAATWLRLKREDAEADDLAVAEAHMGQTFDAYMAVQP